MPEVVGVRFHGVGKAYDFDLNGYTVRTGDAVVVETSKGLQVGFCADQGKMREERHLFGRLLPILRIAYEEDLAQYELNRQDEAEAFRICRDKIDDFKLDMNLVDAEYTLDRQRLLFYFTADERVDFRNIVRELASIFRCRIELRQIGVRDEAKMSGGVGICGREFCCSSWLNEFVPVSVKMAKTQSLSMNPTKISGCCGRLMCCLKYEQDQYTETKRIAPRYGSTVLTPRGEGTVLNVNLLTEAVTVSFEDETDDVFQYQIDELEYKGPSRRPLNSSCGNAPRSAMTVKDGSGDNSAELLNPSPAAGGCASGCGASCGKSKLTLSDDDESRVVAVGGREQQDRDNTKSKKRIGKPAKAGFIPHMVSPEDDSQ